MSMTVARRIRVGTAERATDVLGSVGDARRNLTRPAHPSSARIRSRGDGENPRLPGGMQRVRIPAFRIVGIGSTQLARPPVRRTCTLPPVDTFVFFIPSQQGLKKTIPTRVIKRRGKEKEASPQGVRDERRARAPRRRAARGLASCLLDVGRHAGPPRHPTRGGDRAWRDCARTVVPARRSGGDARADRGTAAIDAVGGGGSPSRARSKSFRVRSPRVGVAE